MSFRFLVPALFVLSSAACGESECDQLRSCCTAIDNLEMGQCQITGDPTDEAQCTSLRTTFVANLEAARAAAIAQGQTPPAIPGECN